LGKDFKSSPSFFFVVLSYLVLYGFSIAKQNNKSLPIVFSSSTTKQPRP